MNHKDADDTIKNILKGYDSRPSVERESDDKPETVKGWKGKVEVSTDGGETFQELSVDLSEGGFARAKEIARREITNTFGVPEKYLGGKYSCSGTITFPDSAWKAGTCGQKEQTPETCPECKGKGKIALLTSRVTCDNCEGEGKVEA